MLQPHLVFLLVWSWVKTWVNVSCSRRKALLGKDRRVRVGNATSHLHPAGNALQNMHVYGCSLAPHGWNGGYVLARLCLAPGGTARQGDYIFADGCK